jgi:hypothetical protein
MLAIELGCLLHSRKGDGRDNLAGSAKAVVGAAKASSQGYSVITYKKVKNKVTLLIV